jgi:flavin-dependent dehydrogenase
VKVLPVDVWPVVEDVITRLDVRSRYAGAPVRHRYTRPLAWMTQRRRLDQFLAERAADAGADFQDGVRVRDIELGDRGATVCLDGGRRVSAEVVIGADGVNGVSARALGQSSERTFGVALEGNAPMTPERERRHRSAMLLELAVVPGGYGWIFPKADHVNFGVGGFAGEGSRMRDHLALLCAQHGADVEELENLRGYRMPLRRRWGGAAQGRAVVVGDAAGILDPFSGDGMFEAFTSSEIASETALDVLAGRAESMAAYDRRLERSLAGHAAGAWVARAAAERFPDAVWRMARTPAAARVLGHRLASRTTERRIPLIDRLERAARRALEPRTS